ncbi:adenylate cyclase associated N terminal-domain-containing protein [Immersiella caudata]|uniref:Adenylyl cyclase-associated protein n=1 Tax=Immersiella caudata TaxID=314043 RepID=A0AA40C7D1_9PEZI|nr:adenylate cyclase associated N terminal-domain-containing protein [Immersiella caudata]
MATNNMHNLTTLIKRLEAATARLEDIASSTIELPQGVPALKETLATPQSGIINNAPAAAAPPPPPAPAPEPVPESIEEFDAFINSTVQKYAKLSKDIGGLLAEQAEKVVQGFQEQRKFLLITTKSKKPDLTGSEMSVYQDLLRPINEVLMAVTKIKETNRSSPVFNALSSVADSFVVSAWVTVDARPHKHIEECLGTAVFYGNRVLKEYKESDPKMIEWLQSYYKIFRDLTDYVKNYFPNGVPWNPKGRPAQEVVKSLSAAPSAPPAPAAGGPPPPPPPPPGPPPVLQINEVKAQPTASSGLGAVFSELNQGEAITKSLRKVDKSQMTHKNPSLRASSTVPERDSSVRGKSPAPGKKPKPDVLRVKKPPKMELEGNKWIVEHYENAPAAIMIKPEYSQSILISRCAKSTIVIEEKANAVSVENASRVILYVNDLISKVDVVRAQNIDIHLLGDVQSVELNQVDGAGIYLTDKSMKVKVTYSQSVGVNINTLIPGSNGDYKEWPLPTQMVSEYTGGAVVTTIESISG